MRWSPVHRHKFEWQFVHYFRLFGAVEMTLSLTEQISQFFLRLCLEPLDRSVCDHYSAVRNLGSIWPLGGTAGRQ